MTGAASAPDDARGQYRTTTTEWARVPPYVRFRYERARELLPRNPMPVVELGTGIGVALAYLARSRPDLKFVGYELSAAAVDFGRKHFGAITNLRLEAVADVREVARRMSYGSFLIALEVLEHLDDTSLDVFKRELMARVDECVFSHPYAQQNIEGTDHLQSLDIYDIFEIFPGFETLFIRRHSIKFIGHWRRCPRGYVREFLGVAGEDKAIAAIANVEGAATSGPSWRQPLRSLAGWATRCDKQRS